MAAAGGIGTVAGATVVTRGPYLQCGTPNGVTIRWRTSDSTDTRDAFLAWTGSRGADLWLMLGDNAYSSGADAEYQAALFTPYALPLREWVLWPTRGNHDQIFSGANNDYYDLFTLPQNGEAGGLPS